MCASSYYWIKVMDLCVPVIQIFPLFVILKTKVFKDKINKYTNKP
jgi:hypothetical protein